MNDAPETPPEPAESRAIELLRLVGSQTPDTSARFTSDVVKRARTQRAFVVPLRVLGGLVAALAAAIAAASETSRGGQERRS
jgi:hypothetical protein